MIALTDRIVSSALAAVGLGADVDPVAYGAHLGGPGETPAMCLGMATYYDPHTGAFSSTCGLERRAIEREAGVDDPRLRAPYRPGSAITDLLAVSEGRGALEMLSLTGHYDAPAIAPGDAVFVDCDAAHRDGHVYTVVTEPVTNDDGTITFESVDGGHGAPGHQATVRRTKTWRRGVYGGWYDQAADGGPQRRVTHVTHAEKLANGPVLDACGDAGPQAA